MNFRTKGTFARRESGFTLLELMVVVAIIGILSAIAIPNFRLYQSRARQSEAKIGLASVYTAEQSLAAEQGSFSACLVNIGFQPQGAKRYYGVGFSGTGGNTCGPTGALPCLGYGWTSATGAATQTLGCADNVNVTYYLALDKAGTLAIPTRANLPATTLPAQATFIVGAVGSIGGAALDIWTINQQKSLVQTQDGVP